MGIVLPFWLLAGLELSYRYPAYVSHSTTTETHASHPIGYKDLIIYPQYGIILYMIQYELGWARSRTEGKNVRRTLYTTRRKAMVQKKLGKSDISK